MDIAAARLAKVWPMQDIDAEGHIRFRYWVKLRGDMEKRYAGLERAGWTRVWVTPKVPFFVPLLVGAIAWVWVRSVAMPVAP
jgi:hypothetical protein